MNEHKFSLVMTNAITAHQLSIEEIQFCLDRFNTEYRKGFPLVSDERYDHEFKAALAKLSPSDNLLTRVEPEPLNAFGDLPLVRHKTPMLSTDNALNAEAISKFIKQVQQAADEIGIDTPTFRATGKLDGWSGSDVDGVLATRGSDGFGSDVSIAFQRGVIPIGGRDQGVGEIIVDIDYFTDHLSDEFTCGRNFIASIIGSETPREATLKALSDKACHFVPYSTLYAWQGDGGSFNNDYLAICEDIERGTPYELDGIVLEVVEEDLKRHMGATSHHHRWMIAIKLQSETSEQTVTDIEWTVGRSGTVTPTAIYEPVFLSGATLSRALAHNARRVLDWKIGVGAVISIQRSGSVIPRINSVTTPSDNVVVPTECPCCSHALIFDDVKLMCPNALGCSAQAVRGIFHFCNIMGNINSFGEKSIEKMVKHGITYLPFIFTMSEQDFEVMGFGNGEAKRFVKELERGRTEAVSDWKFLASFGIHTLGRGDSRKLLEVYPLEVLNTLTEEDVEKIHGFGDVTAKFIVEGIADRWELISSLMELGFNLERTASIAPDLESPIKGKFIVFTGSMQHGSRDDMTKQARALGAKPQSGVSASKTDMVVLGDRVGQKKLDDVAKFNAAGANIKLISELDYIALLGGSVSVSTDVVIFNTSMLAS